MPLNIEGYEIRGRDVRLYEQTGIVRSGLILHLDASIFNTVTYGATWFDISGNGNNGTMVNGPTYNSGNGGSVVFDGVNDYISLTYQTSPFRQTSQITYSFWTYKNITGQLSVMGTSVSGGGGTGAVYFGNDTAISFYWCPSNPVSDRQITGTISNTLNNWNHFTFTMIYATGTYQWYQNGSPVTSTLSNSVTTFTPTTSFNQNINDYVGGWYVNSPTYYSGNISQVQIYNRALSAAEVLHNYNVTKGRFGL